MLAVSFLASFLLWTLNVTRQICIIQAIACRKIVVEQKNPQAMNKKITYQLFQKYFFAYNYLFTTLFLFYE